MLIKSFVTVTTSYRNTNWESKLRREGNDTDSKFWNQSSSKIQSIERAKGARTRLPANEATFCYQSSFVNYFGGTPYTCVCP
jgi:hypothetical protein